MTDLNKVKKVYRTTEGEVITEPKNFLTQPMKKGQTGKNVYLGGKIPYKEDPFDNKKQIEKKERDIHNALL